MVDSRWILMVMAASTPRIHRSFDTLGAALRYIAMNPHLIIHDVYEEQA